MSLPYQPRAPLSDPSWFFGREQDLQRLFSHLDKPAPQNVQIVGQRRIGKTWMLKKLALDENLRKANLGEPNKFTFIYWDLQMEHQLGREMFIPRLLEIMFRHLPSELATECRDAVDMDEPEESLREVLELLEIDGHRVVLLMDEFAAITSNTEFGDLFFGNLRAFFNKPSMSCVTASFRSLGEMCHLGPDSPFFNIFTRIQLRLFELDEAKQFITIPFESAGFAVDDAAVNAILRLTGPHPCFISQLCHGLAHDAQVKKSKRLTKEDVERHDSDFRSSAFDDFTYYLDTLKRLDGESGNESSPATDMLYNIAQNNYPESTENRTFTRLYDLSLIRLSGGRPMPFSVAFGQHLQETKGTDIYFEKAFSNPALEGPSYVRICEVALEKATHIPDDIRSELEAAIRNIQGRPQDAMRICGRDILGPILTHVYGKTIGGKPSGGQYDTCQTFDTLAEKQQFPKFLASSFNAIRIAGNDGSHSKEYIVACTPGRAFLTVLETAYLASEIYRRYP